MDLLRRRRALPLVVAAALTLSGGPAAGADRDAPVIGRVAGAHPVVQGWEQDPAAARALKVQDPVHDEMSVRTGRGAGALITVGQPQQGGRVQLGPKTEVRFTDWVLDTASGEIRKLSLRLQLGQLWAAFAPPPGKQLREGEYWILTARGRIRLLGTSVYVLVEPDGATSVYVLDGSVRIQPEGGEPLHLERGFWTRVPADGRPSPPSRIERSPSAPPLGIPGDREISDPPRLDLRDIRLDLPKSGRPPE